MFILSPLDWFALFWFLFCWGGYTLFTNQMMLKHPNISNTLSQLRLLWIQAMIKRNPRIADTTSLATLQKTATFFASTSIFILAGLLAVLGSSDKAIQLINALPFVVDHSQSAWEIKILLLASIFIYAFFKFSWCVRQYNFALVMFGAAPEPEAQNCDDFVKQANVLLTAANKSFSYGMRAYTFAMPALSWLVQPYLFIVASGWVVAVSYRREYKSRTLDAMLAVVNKS